MKPEIEEFARLLIEHVRDMAVDSCDSTLHPEATHVVAQRWREHILKGDASGLAHVMIPDCVDEVLFYLLDAIDQGVLRLSFIASNGNSIDLTEAGDGELSGWYMGTDAWRSRYSKSRFIDDFKDIS